MTRISLVAGNWKMHTTVEEAVALVDAMRDALEAVTGVERVLCPPFVSLPAVRARVAGTSLRVGAQNMHYEAKGAFTGEISPTMLVGLADFAILGHSERRQYFGETDELVNRKVHAALAYGLRPIVCVGETLAENEAGRTGEVIARQVRGGLAGVGEAGPLVVAYEPVWAIGTGRPATPDGANRVMGQIRGLLGELLGPAAAEGVPILYGGSVTPESFSAFMAQPEVDGGLVGGASLSATSFVALARQAAEARR